MLRAIKNEIIRKKFGDYSETFIVEARVPIIKSKCKTTGINFDIS